MKEVRIRFEDDYENFIKVKYYEEYVCPICGSRIDEEGFCSCGSAWD
jgi:hypothetical protein